MQYVKLYFTQNIWELSRCLIVFEFQFISTVVRECFLYEFSTFKFIENYSVTQHIVYVLWTFHPCLKRLYRAMVDAVLYKFNLVKLFAGVWQFFYIFSCFLHYWGRCVKISYCLWIFCFLHILYTMCFKDLFWLHLDCCIFLMNWSFTIMN